MPRRAACLTGALAFLFALAALAVSAAACEGGGGGGGAELTTLSTKLSGEGKEGEEITLLEGSKVKDKATLSGKNASKATGTVNYKVYSDKECKTLVVSAGEATVSGESVPASSEEELEGARTYYWQAHYGGDSKNAESTSPCTESSTIKAKTTLTAILSSELTEGAEISVVEGAKIKSEATLSGTKASTATGSVAYEIYSNKECTTLFTSAGEVTVSSGIVPASSEVELPAGTSYWQAVYTGDGLHQKSTSTCGEQVARVKPKPPSVEQVDFKNAQPVLIDHQKKAEPANEAAVAINQVGENNEVEWQLSTTMGDTKNWPVDYVRQTKPRLEARFAVTKGTEAFIEKKLEAGYKVTVTGSGTLGGVAISLEVELTKAELESTKGKGYITTGTFEAKNAILANAVLYEAATITWKWKIKEAGQAAFEQEIGKTTHQFFLTNAAPLGGSANYLTLLDLETKGIQAGAAKQPPTEAEQIKGIWNEFKTRAIGLRWYEIEPGNLFRGGKELEYYEENPTVGKTLKEVDEAGIPSCTIEGVAGLLRQAEGKCGAWALAYSYALASEGISSAVLKVEPESGAGKEKCAAAGECQLLIKNWQFVGAGKPGGLEFNYDATEINDLQGIPGQGPPKNPPAIFNLHYIVEVPNKGKTLYDPSYGTGPYAGAEPIKEFQEASIEGICGPFEAGTHQTQCKKVGPGLVKVVAPVSLEFK